MFEHLESMPGPNDFSDFFNYALTSYARKAGRFPLADRVVSQD